MMSGTTVTERAHSMDQLGGINSGYNVSRFPSYFVEYINQVSCFSYQLAIYYLFPLLPYQSCAFNNKIQE